MTGVRRGQKGSCRGQLLPCRSVVHDNIILNQTLKTSFGSAGATQ